MIITSKEMAYTIFFIVVYTCYAVGIAISFNGDWKGYILVVLGLLGLLWLFMPEKSNEQIKDQNNEKISN